MKNLRRIGQYDVIGPIGKGGFAYVDKVEHQTLGTIWALKRLEISDETPEKEKKIHDFLLEAKACANLQHENIIQVTDCGREGDIVYMVMPYISGGTLRAHINPGKHPSPHGILVPMKSIASALQFAHDKGYMHLDVKPENILIDKEKTIRFC